MAKLVSTRARASMSPGQAKKAPMPMAKKTMPPEMPAAKEKALPPRREANLPPFIARAIARAEQKKKAK